MRGKVGESGRSSEQEEKDRGDTLLKQFTLLKLVADVL